MLPPINRLPRREIKMVMHHGRRRTLPHLTVIYRKTATSRQPRFACIVPVGVDKRASTRNRIKRLLRESLRKLLPEIKQGTDGVFIARKKLETEEAQNILIGVCRELLDSSKTSRSKNGEL